MFRDSRGVVHTVSSPDPLLDLPADTADALARALLRPGDADLEAALDRCEAVRELLERWQDAFFAALPDEVDPAEEARWAAEAGLSLEDLEAAYDEDDEDDLDGGAGGYPGDGPEPIDLTDDALAGLALPDEDDEQDELLALVPGELVHLLERELLLLPLRVRLEALVAAAALVGTWSDLLADQEKLLGHLVLAHGETPAAGDLARPAGAAGHAALATRHAHLHARSGPGHPG